MSGERTLETLGELERERQREAAAAPAEALLSADFKSRLAARALADVRAADGQKNTRKNTRTQRRWAITTGAVAAALAASLLLWVVRAPVLPRYEVELIGGERTLRAGETAAPAVPRLTAGGALVLELRPEEPVAGEIETQSYWFAAGRLEVWETAAAVSPEGAVRIELQLDERAPQVNGAGELVVVVARAGALPSRDRVEAELRAPASRGKVAGAFRVFRRPVEIEVDSRGG